MKKLFCFLGFMICLSANPSNNNVLYGQKDTLLQSQVLQRNHIEQMRFTSIYQWRVWGMMHLDLKKNFIRKNDSLVGFLPQVGLDREYPLASSSIPSSLLVGVDLDGNVGSAKSGSEELQGGGYGIGGYMLWRTEDGYFASFATKYIQTFQKVLEKQFCNSMWAFDMSGGKRFELGEGYFVEASANLGAGVILDSKVAFEYNNQNITHFLEPLISYNIMLSAFMGRKIGKNEVKIGFSPFGELYSGGKGVIIASNGYEKIITPNLSRFDILLSIAYNMNLTDKIDLYTYGDFHALELHGTIGIGVRVGFGENVYTPLKYPKFKLDKLKKTYLK